MFNDNSKTYRLWPTLIIERHATDTSWHDNWSPSIDENGKLDLFVPGEGNQRLRDMFNAAVDEWLVEAGAEGMLGMTRTLTDCGCVRYQGCEYIPTHWHGGELAVVYYMQSSAGVSIPAHLNEAKGGGDVQIMSGSLVFFDPRGAMNRFPDAGDEHRPWREFRPQQGTLLVFPSYLLHTTTPHRFGADRVVVAGNIRFLNEARMGKGVLRRPSEQVK